MSITHPMTYPPTAEGLCERCHTRTRIRAVRTDAGVEQVCERCAPTEFTTSTEG